MIFRVAKHDGSSFKINLRFDDTAGNNCRFDETCEAKTEAPIWKTRIHHGWCPPPSDVNVGLENPHEY